MKINEITQNPVLAIIQKAQAVFGEDALSGGNCGTFALAVSEKLRQNGIRVELGFLYRDLEGIDDVRDITVTETDLYHVVVEYKNRYYDGTGVVTVDTLLDIANDQYSDDAPGFFREVDPVDPITAKVIRNDTNWSIPVEKFLKAL